MISKQSPYNDLVAQCSRKLIKLPKEEELARIKEIRNCNHLFVKLRENEKSIYSSHDIPTIECVHCGVTNKYVDLEYTLNKFPKSLEYYVLTRFHHTNIEYNECTIETEMMNEICYNKESISLMSDKIVRTLHPSVLYHIAKLLYPDDDNEKLITVMQKLSDLETPEERNGLCSIFDAKELIDRYNKEEEKTLKKEL